MFGPGCDEAPKVPRIMLVHVWEGAVESLASIIASFGKCTVSKRCKWVAWTLGLCCALLVLMCSEALGVEPGLDTLLVLVGVAGCTGGHW